MTRPLRILFVVPPLAGHTIPTAALGAALQNRGHTVAWCAHPTAVRPWLPPGATLLPLDETTTAEQLHHVTERAQQVRGAAAFQLLWQDFLIPLAQLTLPAIEAAVASWSPDLLLVDQQALAGALVARRLHLPWATLVTTSAGITDELDSLPKVRAWRDDLLLTLQRDAGLDPVPTPDLSPTLSLVLSTRDLIGPQPLPASAKLVGPLLGAHRQPVPFPWHTLDDRPKLIVTLGTVNAERGARFYQVVRDAFPDPDLHVLLAAPAALTGPLPDHFLRQDRLPLLDLLPHAAAVLCHAGHNTVCEALAHGVPLVLAPIKDDQPIVAQQVERAGAGVRVRFGRVGAERLREVVAEVMGDGRFREAAGRVAAGFREAGGVGAAVGWVEGVLG